MMGTPARVKTAPQKDAKKRAGGKAVKLEPPLAYFFKLFIGGNSPKSTLAIQKIKRICEKEFPGKYQLEVIDIYQQPHLAALEQIKAVPALVQRTGKRARILVGDVSGKLSAKRAGAAKKRSQR